MARRPTSAAPAPAPSASFVVVLYCHGTYRGMAGPLPTDAAARQWAEEVVGEEPGWTWVVEPVVHPDALPTAAERGRAARPQLRLLRGAGDASLD